VLGDRCASPATPSAAAVHTYRWSRPPGRACRAIARTLGSAPLQSYRGRGTSARHDGPAAQTPRSTPPPEDAHTWETDSSLPAASDSRATPLSCSAASPASPLLTPAPSRGLAPPQRRAAPSLPGHFGHLFWRRSHPHGTRPVVRDERTLRKHACDIRSAGTFLLLSLARRLLRRSLLGRRRPCIACLRASPTSFAFGSSRPQMPRPHRPGRGLHPTTAL
jgi:hypothetical protein